MSLFKFGTGARGAATLALLTGVVQAIAAPAVTLDNVTGLTLGNPPFTLGWAFTTNSAITVTALGVFDGNQDGLAERHTMGLWDSGGTLLATTIVGAGTADPLTNQFRYSSLSSGVSLSAGASYTIGALFSSGADDLIFPGSAINFGTASAINFSDARYAGGNTLANPVSSAGADPAYFAANFLFDAAGTVPEPTSMLLTALALVALGASRSRKPAAQAETA